MINKIKKGLTDAKDKTARGVQYAKSKTKGFKHPDLVEYHINVIRANRDSIPKLYERLNSVCDAEKALVEAQSKAYSEWIMLGGNTLENPILAEYIKAWANCQFTISEARSNFFLSIDEIRQDFKMFKNAISEIQVAHDRVNHSLTDAEYWRNHSNSAKFEQSESKYKQNLSSLLEMKDEMIFNKEQKFDNYIINWNNAEIEFYTKALESARAFQAQLRNIGPMKPSERSSLDITQIDLNQFRISEKSRSESQSEFDAPFVSTTRTTMTVQPIQSPSNIESYPDLNPMTAVAISDFNARNEKELSIRTGDRLLIKTRSENWSFAELNGNMGFVPSNYINFL